MFVIVCHFQYYEFFCQTTVNEDNYVFLVQFFDKVILKSCLVLYIEKLMHGFMENSFFKTYLRLLFVYSTRMR